jgi:hypothetical protein
MKEGNGIRLEALLSNRDTSKTGKFMLLVVFGAGASYDSSMDYSPSVQAVDRDGLVIQLRAFRPPLANELFDLRGIFANAAEKISKCQLVLNELRSRPTEMSVEQQLKKLSEQAADYPEGKRQLLAVQFYLQWTISECQAEWNRSIKSHTTYRPLLGQIDRQRRGEPVCLVTFNYDTLLEEAFSSLNMPFVSIDDYISRSGYKVIKPHGSVNWVRALTVTSTRRVDSMDQVQMANRIIAIADTLEPSEDYYLAPEKDRGAWVISRSSQIPKTSGSYQIVLPAIAIPLEKKTGYACPASHVRVLEESVSKTEKLLLIGWKGAEYAFVNLLGKRLRKDIPKMIVSSNKQSAMKIRDAMIEAKLSTGVDGWQCAEHGFADTVRSGEIEDFIKR